MRKGIRNTLFLALLAFAATASQAQQIKCWNDANGKRTCGDTPPPGARVTTLKTPSGPSGPAPSAKGAAAKDAKKGPLTPAEQEQEYRKRQAEAQKAAAKAEEEQKFAEDKRENCQRAQEMLRALESGQRIARTDSKGERYYMDEAQTAQEVTRTRAQVQQACG